MNFWQRLVVFSVPIFVCGTASAQYTEGISVIEPRDKSWTPEQSRKAIELDGPYEVQLVASEPLIHDPVEMIWDAKGRCFVADMMDYPLGPSDGQKPLSRIVQLLEPDKNGRYTKAKVFADHVDHVQGLLPYKDGLIATTRTQILFLRDTKGDGVADEIKPLIEGFNPSHSQLQVASPRWGLDNCVYFNNGLNSGEIYPTANPDGKMKVARTNLRWDPATGKLELATGNGQFGGCFDDWGRHFFCSNRNPVMFAVMPHEAVVRNPHAGIAQGWEDIAPSGGETKVYPLQLSHTTADAHAGTHTAACGLGVYRGDLMPELRGEIFVCEPTAQCIVRYHVEPNGASLKATRVGDHTEFFRSRDEWCRPVNVTTGPDGALYICDIYRRFIDHARFFPEAFVKSHDMRAGDHEGRIWRVVPKGCVVGSLPTSKEKTSSGRLPETPSAAPPVLRPIEPAPSKVEDLVAWLGHQNAWQRETAQRLLVEMKPKDLDGMFAAVTNHRKQKSPDPAMLGTIFDMHWSNLAVGLVKRNGFYDMAPAGVNAEIFPKEESHFNAPAWFLRRRGALFFQSGLSAGVAFGPDTFALLCQTRSFPPDYLAKVATQFASEWHKGGGKVTYVHIDDPWMQRAILSASTDRAGKVLSAIMSQGDAMKTYASTRAEFVRALASCSAADGEESDVHVLLSTFKQNSGKLTWWKPALLQGLAEGLPKSGGKLGVKSLAELTSKPPEAYKEAAAEITALLAQVDKVMTDAAAPMEQRLAVIPLLPQRKWEQAEPILRALFADGQPPDIGTAALAVLRKFSTDKTAPLLYELLSKAGPAARRDIVTLLSSGKTLLDFLQRMDRGEVPKSFIGAEQRWGLGRNANPQIKELATKLFGTVSSDRAAMIAKYMDVTKMKGDSKKGHEVFKTICITCHKIRGEGVEIGPDITDVRIKPTEALLTDILDPNRICEPRFMAYQVETKDGRVVSGIVAAENSDSVTLKLAGGVTEAVPRSNIKTMKCLDQSLMPVGLEATINKEQMADLMAFLRGE